MKNAAATPPKIAAKAPITPHVSKPVKYGVPEPSGLLPYCVLCAPSTLSFAKMPFWVHGATWYFSQKSSCAWVRGSPPPPKYCANACGAEPNPTAVKSPAIMPRAIKVGLFILPNLFKFCYLTFYELGQDTHFSRTTKSQPRIQVNFRIRDCNAVDLARIHLHKRLDRHELDSYYLTCYSYFGQYCMVQGKPINST